nr:proline-rich receptor-like protein kinase PERK2 [Lolium perenne]
MPGASPSRATVVVAATGADVPPRLSRGADGHGSEQLAPAPPPPVRPDVRAIPCVAPTPLALGPSGPLAPRPSGPGLHTPHARPNSPPRRLRPLDPPPPTAAAARPPPSATWCSSAGAARRLAVPRRPTTDASAPLAAPSGPRALQAAGAALASASLAPASLVPAPVFTPQEVPGAVTVSRGMDARAGMAGVPRAAGHAIPHHATRGRLLLLPVGAARRAGVPRLRLRHAGRRPCGPSLCSAPTTLPETRTVRLLGERTAAGRRLAANSAGMIRCPYLLGLPWLGRRRSRRREGPLGEAPWVGASLGTCLWFLRRDCPRVAVPILSWHY